jgi:hypothetical protein
VPILRQATTCPGLHASHHTANLALRLLGALKDRYSEPERGGGSEWEPIKILLEGDGNSYKMNTASNTRLRLITQVSQAHVATGVPLDLGTNTNTLPTREHSRTTNLESTDPHRPDR